MARLTIALTLLLAACSFDVQTDPYLGLDRFEAAADDPGTDPASPDDAPLDAPAADPGTSVDAGPDAPSPACATAADCLGQVTLPGPCHRPQCDAGTCAVVPNPAGTPCTAEGPAVGPCEQLVCAADATCTDLKPKSNGAPCDDADPCTSDDRCDALGACTGAPVPEPCP